MPAVPRVAALKTADHFAAHLRAVAVRIPFDDALDPAGPLAQPLVVAGRTVGNRFAVLPMEGWDANTDGTPSDLTRRRWARFGGSGAKLIWGGEAAAVRPDGRANPNQLIASAANVPALAELRQCLVSEHAAACGRTDDLLVGLQLTHSGRFCRPIDKKRLESHILYPHPLLNPKFGLNADHPVLSDGDIRRLIEDFVLAAEHAAGAGFDFVDIKCCHGYLGHEFLSAVDRPGDYGGSFEGRTRFVREVIEGVRAAVPGLLVGVRVSAFDMVPFRKGVGRVGEPEAWAGPYPYAFGGDGTGTGIDLTEPIRFLKLLESLGVKLVCVSGGNPYSNPHLLRPALFPPSDGYHPPEDPLAGVARQLEAAAKLRAAVPGLAVVGSGYTYLQEWLPKVGQAVVRGGGADFVGLGRVVLSYPELPADVLAGRPLQFKKLCRTFSDCTTAPRNGLVSGCYPLDPFYKARPEAKELAVVKRG